MRLDGHVTEFVKLTNCGVAHSSLLLNNH